MARKEKAIARKEILCPHCDTQIEVSTRAQSTMCKGCNKIIQVGDEKIKSYCARQDLFTEGTVTVAKKGHVIAKMRVRNLVVQGAVKGPVRARESVLIEKSGKIVGDLSAPLLSVKEGGQLVGYCVIGIPVEQPQPTPPPAPKPTLEKKLPQQTGPKKRRFVKATRLT